MEAIILLREVIRPHLGWHGARLTFVAAFLNLTISSQDSKPE